MEPKENQLPSSDPEFGQLSSMLRSRAFALDISQKLEAAYNQNLTDTQPAILPEQVIPEMVAQVGQEEKIAVNLAGFYALECGVDYLATLKRKRPSEILQSIVDESLLLLDRDLLCRFANATWKAGQPFRDLNRITRDAFVPYSLLPELEKKKDWVQIKTAAALVLANLKITDLNQRQ
ncbi:hypothetical protein GCM10023189_58940 [Nibrella saemangeumensis]|uniref:Uncharacterized protein n=1 Tax=Nibrella saemangeumensis TaxID=1084526 RepID=A0ABP8NP35_9BACT